MAALMAAQDGLGDDGPLGTAADRRVKAERPGYEEYGARKMLASAPAMYAAMLATITDVASGLDRLDDLRSLQLPSLVLVGEEDTPFRKPSARMAEAIPGAELVVIPDAGHSPQFEAPEAWWGALEAFLTRV
jgi:pimeloyl-ACP methyl ester carboxylesterase